LSTAENAATIVLSGRATRLQENAVAILRRADQEKKTLFPGVERYTVADAETGALRLKIGDLFWSPGSSCPYHTHPESDSEETQYIVEGEIEAIYEGRRFTVRAGDAILSPPRVPHGFVNNSGAVCRMVTAFPTTNRSYSSAEIGLPESGPMPPAIVFRKDVVPTTPYEGLARHDLVTAQQGATSTTFLELVFEPGARIPPHIHQDDEEALFLLEGELRAIDGDEEDIPLSPGDLCLAEPGIRHGLTNASDRKATLLALFPTTAPASTPVD